MKNHSDNSNEQKSNSQNSEDKFMDNVNKRFEKLKNKLDKSLNEKIKKRFEQKGNSKYLFKQLNKLDDVIINSTWKGSTSKAKFDCFAILMKKYHRIDGNKKECYWYIEIHSKDNIECILCLKDKLDEYLDELDYNVKSVRKQIEIGARIINPEIIKSSFKYDWRNNVWFENKAEVSLESFNELKSRNQLCVFSVLEFAVLALVLDRVDTSDHKLLIPNIIYSDKTKDFVKKLINACYIRTKDSELLSVQSIYLNKNTDPETIIFDARPLIVYYSKEDDSLLREKLNKYYTYLSTQRKVNFPYKGIPFILSQEKISNNFFTIDLSDIDISQTEQITKTINTLYSNLFLPEDLWKEIPKFNRKYYQLINDNFVKFKKELVKFLAKKYFVSSNIFSFADFTQITLLVIFSQIMKASFYDKEKVNEYFIYMLNYYFSYTESLENSAQRQIQRLLPEFTKSNEEKCITVIKKINELIAGNKIQFTQNKDDIKIEEDYSDLIVLSKIGKNPVLMMGDEFCKKLISDFNITNYTYKQFIADAKRLGFSKCDNKKNKLSVQIGDKKTYLIVFPLNHNQIHIPK